eukprot:NODE_4_length_77007_cov_1.156642.p53 type:complete len:203 gc:universal NODE_4_length_77007_cov_1.156642:58542-57934(-)
MTIKLSANKIHGITGPFGNLLCSLLLLKEPELYVYNPHDIELYLPKIETKLSKVKFNIAYQYEHDKIEQIVEHLEPLKEGIMNLNHQNYQVKNLKKFEVLNNGLLVFVSNPTAEELYQMRKTKMTCIIICDEFLDLSFYDFCYITEYSTEILKKTEYRGFVKIEKPYTTDLFILECNDQLTLDVFRLPSLLDSSGNVTNEDF